MYLGPEAVPQNETQVKVHDKIFNIEEVIPLEKRSEKYKQMMVTLPEKRKSSYNSKCLRVIKMSDHRIINSIENIMYYLRITILYELHISKISILGQSPLNCLTCRDNEMTPCKDCGCFLCLGKNNPEKVRIYLILNMRLEIPCLVWVIIINTQIGITRITRV